jgi:hypothetical protein
MNLYLKSIRKLSLPRRKSQRFLNLQRDKVVSKLKKQIQSMRMKSLKRERRRRKKRRKRKKKQPVSLELREGLILTLTPVRPSTM